MVDRIKKWYASLPKWAQGLVTAAEAGAVGFLVQWITNPQPICLSKQCLQQFGGALLAAIAVAIRNWLKKSPLVAAADAPIAGQIAQKQ